MNKIFKISVGFLLLALAVLYIIGSILVRASHQQIGEIPNDLSNSQVVSFNSGSGAKISGWFLKGKREYGGLLLLHGVRSNRLQMLKRAKFLQSAGYSVLLFDFQAHGESTGDKITFGYLESKDVEAAYNYLNDKLTNKTIGVIGVSLGGASILLSSVKFKAKTIVLESVYPTIKEAINNRLEMRLGSLGIYISPLLTMQLKPRLGISVNDLRPIDHLKNVKGALFIISGVDDKRTTLSETKRMYKMGNKPKELWLVKNYGHVDFSEALGRVYENRLLDFLNRWMN